MAMSLGAKSLQEGLAEALSERPPTEEEVLTHVAKGEMVTVVPYGAELSTKEAADLLNVSRPFLIKLLEQGEIGFHRVGSHRRIEAEELLRYKKARDSQRREAMKELQRLGQEFDAA